MGCTATNSFAETNSRHHSMRNWPSSPRHAPPCAGHPRFFCHQGVMARTSPAMTNSEVAHGWSGSRKQFGPRLLARARFSVQRAPQSGRGGEIAELLQVLFLLLVARRQLEQARRGAAEDVVLGLFREERQV